MIDASPLAFVDCCICPAFLREALVLANLILRFSAVFCRERPLPQLRPCRAIPVSCQWRRHRARRPAWKKRACCLFAALLQSAHALATAALLGGQVRLGEGLQDGRLVGLLNLDQLLFNLLTKLPSRGGAPGPSCVNVDVIVADGKGQFGGCEFEGFVAHGAGTALDEIALCQNALVQMLVLLIG